MNTLFQKIDMVCVLRWAGIFLLALSILSAILSAMRGAEFDDVIKIFVINLAGGLFQPLVLFGIAEGIARMNKA